MFRNTHVKAGVRLAGVTLGIAAVGLLGAPAASADPAPLVQETSHVYVENPMAGVGIDLLDCLSAALHKAINIANGAVSPTLVVVDKAADAVAGDA